MPTAAAERARPRWRCCGGGNRGQAARARPSWSTGREKRRRCTGWNRGRRRTAAQARQPWSTAERNDGLWAAAPPGCGEGLTGRMQQEQGGEVHEDTQVARKTTDWSWRPQEVAGGRIVRRERRLAARKRTPNCALRASRHARHVEEEKGSVAEVARALIWSDLRRGGIGGGGGACALL